jgi:predicted PurR-regulated permease PerM
MKIKWDRQYLKYSLYACLTIILAILSYHILDNMGYFVKIFFASLDTIKIYFSPFIMGVFIAYFLNPGVRWFEEGVYGKVHYISERKKLHRILSIVTVYFILMGLIAGLIIIVAPRIGNNIRELIRRVPQYVNITSLWIDNMVEDISLIKLYNFAEPIEKNINELFNRASEILEYVLNNIITSIMMITSGVLNFILGLIISFYLLTDKEGFKKGIEKLLRAILNDKSVDKLICFGIEADDIFRKFVVGKSIDSLIIGAICFIGLSILKVEYALLLSVIVTITNMIPYFGPLIGGVPVVLITFFDSPMKALWVALFILALQQFDGLYLGPKILGDSVGLNPFWIILSIIIGGRLAGVLGMFLGVPTFAILHLVISRWINRQLEQKKIKSSNNT